MVFLHVSDLHLGRSIGEFDLYEDQKYILDRIILSAQNNRADCIFVAGDVYDKSVPSESAVRLFDYFIGRLAELKIKAFIISGNHDSDERVNFGSSLFRDSGIYISSKYGGELMKIPFSDSFGEVNIYLMPFIRASQVRHFYPDFDIPDYNAAVKTVLEHAQIDPSARNVLLAHQFVVGSSSEPSFSGSESAAAQSVGLVEKVHADCFDGFDYVALGHIHSAQSVERDGIRYSGSSLKYSLSESRDKKYITVVTLNEKGSLDIKPEELRPLRDLRHIKGRLEQLLDSENITAQDDFIYATLTDEDIVDNAMGIFQQFYPRTVKIDYDNSHTRGVTEGVFFGKVENKPFAEVFAEFYEQMYGCGISDDELRMIKETAKEAGVINETD